MKIAYTISNILKAPSKTLRRVGVCNRLSRNALKARQEYAKGSAKMRQRYSNLKNNLNNILAIA